MGITGVRRGGTLLVMLAWLLLVSLVAAPAAHACSCMDYDLDEAIEAADLIADVTVEHEIVDIAGDVTYYAVVDTVWKGEETRTIRLRTSSAITACGLGRIEPGTPLLLWGSGGDGSYSTTWCALPRDAPEDLRGALTDRLGEPADLSDQPVPLEADRLPRPGLGVLVAAGILAVVAAGVGLLQVAAVLLGLHLNRRSRR